MEQYNSAQRRADGSYVIQKNGLPYHVPNKGEWEAQWKRIKVYDDANPNVIQDVPAPPPPSLTAQIASMQSSYASKLRVKTQEISAAFALADESALATKRAEYAGLLDEQKNAIDALIIEEVKQ